MSKKTEPEVIQKLDRIAILLALTLARTVTQQRDQVRLLHSAGFKASEIAKLLGISNVTVRVTLFNIRRSERRKQARHARQARK